MFSNHLPLQLTSFIGREREIAGVKHQLIGGDSSASEHGLSSGARLVTLTGTGGAGKTRLAMEVVRGLWDLQTSSESIFPGGIWFIALAALTPSASVAQAIMTALDLREKPGQPLAETLVDRLRTKRTLLLMDNSEHLIPQCVQLFEALLQACPGVTILATSRAALNIMGEVIYPVPPMEIVNPNEQFSLTNLVQCESVRLFNDRTISVHPHFSITDQNVRAVTQICQLLDGIPLAIELCGDTSQSPDSPPDHLPTGRNAATPACGRPNHASAPPQSARGFRLESHPADRVRTNPFPTFGDLCRGAGHWQPQRMCPPTR